ncbi:hypothetical protein CWS02_13885 [Enterobacter sp. EA-1]|nr:hypothetical protein CWS02_13885 [Enterobacter sp. EA-1]
MINKVIDQQTFFDEYPAYQDRLYAPVEQFTELCSGATNNADEFAERCMDILTLSGYSAGLLDQYLGGNRMFW